MATTGKPTRLRRTSADISTRRPRRSVFPETPGAPLLAEPVPPPDALTLPEFRALFTSAPGDAEADSCVAIAESVAGRYGPIALRRFLPATRRSGPGPAILFLHGGGWVAGDLDSHDRISRRIARLSGAQVIAVDYRLAPEHPFPAAVEDAIDAYAMLLPRAAGWDIAADRIAIMGDGAGGTLAAVVALYARDMCLPLPMAQLLLFPPTDMAGEIMSGDVARAAPAGPGLLDWLLDHYVQGGTDPADWRLSPLRAGTLSGLPPTFIALAERDEWCRDGRAFARKLEADGVAVAVRELPGHSLGWLSAAPGAAEEETTLGAALAYVARFTAPGPVR